MRIRTPSFPQAIHCFYVSIKRKRSRRISHLAHFPLGNIEDFSVGEMENIALVHLDDAYPINSIGRRITL
jgi:hypothetical protein